MLRCYVVIILDIFLQGPPSSMKIIMVMCAVLRLVGCFNNTRYSLYSMIIRLGVSVMVFNAIFNNISAILWQSVLLVKETGVPGENHRHWQALSHNVVSSTPRLSGIRNVSGDRHWLHR